MTNVTDVEPLLRTAVCGSALPLKGLSTYFWRQTGLFPRLAAVESSANYLISNPHGGIIGYTADPVR